MDKNLMDKIIVLLKDEEAQTIFDETDHLQPVCKCCLFHRQTGCLFSNS